MDSRAVTPEFLAEGEGPFSASGVEWDGGARSLLVVSSLTAVVAVTAVIAAGGLRRVPAVTGARGLGSRSESRCCRSWGAAVHSGAGLLDHGRVWVFGGVGADVELQMVEVEDLDFGRVVRVVGAGLGSLVFVGDPAVLDAVPFP